MPPPSLRFEGHIYLDLAHPVTAWATALGVLASASSTRKRSAGFPVSILLAGALQRGNDARFHNELLIENVRQQRYPHLVSRLTGIFVFDDEESALSLSVAQWGAHFADDDLVDADVIAQNVTRLDSNWYSYAPRLKNGTFDPEQLNWIDNYWSANACPGRKPVWEVIVDGIAVLRKSASTTRAESVVKAEFPGTEFYLTVGQVATRFGSDACQITAFAAANGHSVEVSYYLNAAPLHDESFIQEFNQHCLPDERELLRAQPDAIYLPDLRRFSVTLPVD